MAEEQAASESQAKSPGGIDGFFSKMSGYLDEKVSAFVAFLFLVLATGIFIGFFVMTREPEYIYHAILAPVILGLIAYYNRAIAMLLFFLFLAFIIFVA